MSLGPWELLIILAIVIAIFGASKIATLGGALGGSIREFKKAIRDDEAEEEPSNALPTTSTSTVQHARDVEHQAGQNSKTL